MNTLGRMALAGALLASAAAFAFPTSWPTPPTTAIEFVNDITGHYVLLNDPAEIAAVEAGSAGPGWRRTSYYFAVSYPGTQVVDGNVCRFYAPSVNTHFLTANATECNYLRNNDTGWAFEKFAFWAKPAVPTCELMLDPVFRLYNNRAAFNDPNHRYTPDPEVRARMIAAGWVDEGIAFCTTSWGRAAEKTFSISSGKLLASADCENEAASLGPCTALNQLPLMPHVVTAFLPPFWVTPNPAFPSEVEAVTGARGFHQVESAYPASDRSAVVWHSFLQTQGSSSLFGIWVNSFDRTQGNLASINPLYQFTTSAPPVGAPDQRVFPWGEGDRDLELSFTLKVATLVRADPQSHAYGHPTLEFIDRVSGGHLYVTLGTYGSVPPEDGVFRDGGTGKVIVSTIFRADPAFGKRISGEFVPCPGQGPCAAAATERFRFRLDRAAFSQVLARARTLDAVLSPDPSHYLLDNFHFNNEVYRDGAIGLRLENYKLEILRP